jgi:hypothetical protein
MAEGPLVQDLCMFPSASQPGSDRGLSVAEDTSSIGRVQPFGQRRQYHRDLVRGGFQTVQRSVASSTEGGVTGLTTKALDLLSMTVLPIPDESMDVSICDPKVQTLLIGTGEAFGVYPLGCPSPAFDLAPGTHRQWRRDDRQGNRVGSGV